MTVPYGRRLLPTTLDQIAQEDPDRAWSSVQSGGSTEFKDTPISVLANAINRVAHWIVKNVGDGWSNGEKMPLAYIGTSDLRYYVMFLAILKAGYVPFFMSHLNSKAANDSLFMATGCKRLLCGFGSMDNVAVTSENIEVIYTPGCDEVWDATPAPLFPFKPSFEEAFSDPLVILHTSGSTGNPKPITYTHGSFALWDIQQNIPDFECQEPEIVHRIRSSRVLTAFPPFHAAGLAIGLQTIVYFGQTLVFPPSDQPLNAQMVINALDHGRIDGAALLPHILEDVARTPEALERVRELPFIFFGAAPLSQKTGDLISARTNLMAVYGSTEMGSCVALRKKDPSLWNYFFFHPLANGFDFRPVPGQDGVYELFIVRDPAIGQAVFRIFPDIDEWQTNDLFVPHPTEKHHWKHVGRSDDLIVFENGSKLNPRPAELIVKGSPRVSEALMFGSVRARPGMLVEPVDECLLDESNTSARKEFLDAVFTYVEESNKTTPHNGIIIRELLALTKADKTFPRSGKRSVQRPAALELYQDEIDSLYNALPSHLQSVKDYRIDSERVA